MPASVERTYDRLKADSIVENISSLYRQGLISADSVVCLAVYHKQLSPEVAERCLQIVDVYSHPRAMMELGVVYAFASEFAGRTKTGLRLLHDAAKAGLPEAYEYLGLYYFKHKVYPKAKASFDAAGQLKYGFSDMALGSMYLDGIGVDRDPDKARHHLSQAALKGCPRGMALYGFNRRTLVGGDVSYHESFYWLYMAGDLGDDEARAALCLPRRKNACPTSEEAAEAQEDSEWEEALHSACDIRADHLYADGFLPSLDKRREQAAQGDDWACFYLGSLNYNGDIIDRDFAEAIRYYEPVAARATLPREVLALVNERLARLYREGKGVESDTTKADRYREVAAACGSLPAYNCLTLSDNSSYVLPARLLVAYLSQ